MRILKVTETYAPFLEYGGPPVKVRALAEGLAHRGHQVTVLTVDWGVAARRDLSGVTRSPFGWCRTENGIEAVYLPTWLRYRTLTWNPAAARFCRARIREFGVVHIYGLYDLLGLRVAAACREMQIPYVLEPIGMFVPIVRNLWLKRMYHKFPGRHMIGGASAVIATSEQEAAELAAGGIAPERIRYRRNGVEKPPPELLPRGAFRARHGIASGAKLILFLGRMVTKKSPDLLLRAFASLPAEMDGGELQLVFAGPDNGGMTARLKDLAVQLGVQTRVHWTGPLFGPAKWAAYHDADVFVLPSQNENFGNTAAESIAAGTPVIVAENCGIAPLLAEEAGLVVPHEAVALSSALKRFFSDAALRETLVAGCAAVLPRLAWDQPVAEMESLYQRLARISRGVGKSSPLSEGQ